MLRSRAPDPCRRANPSAHDIRSLMARRSTHFATTGRKSSFYPDDVLDRVIAAAGGLPEGEVEVAVHFGGVGLFKRVSRRERLRERLETAALSYTLWADSVRQPTPAMLAEAFADVEVPAEKMLRALLQPRAGRSQPERSQNTLYSALDLEIEFLFGRDPVDESLLAKALQYLWMVHRSARVCRRKYERMGKTPRPKRHIGDVTIEFVRQGHENTRLIRIECKSTRGGKEAEDFASAPARTVDE